MVWDLAKCWFVLKLWREGCFFIKPDEQDDTVDRCATEAYEAAISEYWDTQPGGAALITKYRSQPGPHALILCWQLVSVVIMMTVDLPWSDVL